MRYIAIEHITGAIVFDTEATQSGSIAGEPATAAIMRAENEAGVRNVRYPSVQLLPRRGPTMNGYHVYCPIDPDLQVEIGGDAQARALVRDACEYVGFVQCIEPAGSYRERVLGRLAHACA